MTVRVDLAHGLALVGRPTANVQTELALVHGEHRLDQDVIDLRRAAARDTLSRRFAQAAVQAGVVPGIEPQAAASRIFALRAPSPEAIARDAALAEFAASVGPALLQLGDLVEAERARQAEAAAEAAAADGGQGHALVMNDPEPWPEPVDGAALLEDLRDLLARYVALPPGAADVLALWVMHSYIFDRFDHTGYLAIVSPQKRSGKTTLLTALAAVVARPIPAGNISPAAIYRVIEDKRPTMLVDELDRVHRDSDLWTVLNTGHSKGTPVVRVVGDAMEPRAFTTFAPKVICYIRTSRTVVPDTIEDRSIRVLLQRQPSGERKPKLRSAQLRSEAGPLRSKLSRWAADVALATPLVSGELDDRAADSWEPLLAVASAAGGDWPARAAELAVRFSADRGDEESENSIGALLLADLAALIEGGRLDLEMGLSAEEAVRELAALPDRPWSAYGRSGRPITTTALARLLRPYGLDSRKAGPRSGRVWRYPADSVRDVLERYVSGSEGGRATRTPGHPVQEGPVSDSSVSGVQVSDLEPDAEGANGRGKSDTAALDGLFLPDPPAVPAQGELALDGSHEADDPSLDGVDPDGEVAL